MPHHGRLRQRRRAGMATRPRAKRTNEEGSGAMNVIVTEPLPGLMPSSAMEFKELAS
jgi:hypothetical protein